MKFSIIFILLFISFSYNLSFSGNRRSPRPWILKFLSVNRDDTNFTLFSHRPYNLSKNNDTGGVDVSHHDTHQPAIQNQSNKIKDKISFQNIHALWKMTRPGNFPTILLFHIVGIRSALLRIAPSAPSSIIFPVLIHPSIIITLIAIMLISASSMVVNDYYDSRLGVDSIKGDNKQWISNEVSFTMAKEFLYYLYSGILIALAFIPGIPTRLSVVVGTILTFIYTQHLKPRTWIKNIVCAIIMALTPFTSGASTLYIMDDHMRHLIGSGYFTQISQDVYGILYTLITLGPLVLTLFCGFMAREIVMDISDYESDKASGIMTIPVRHSCRVATKVSLGFLVAMVISTCVKPLYLLANANWSDIISRPDLKWLPYLWNIICIPAIMKLFFSVIGSLWMLIRLLEVVRTEGKDKRVLDRFIEEGKTAILFLLASFSLK